MVPQVYSSKEQLSFRRDDDVWLYQVRKTGKKLSSVEVTNHIERADGTREAFGWPAVITLEKDQMKKCPMRTLRELVRTHVAGPFLKGGC